MSTTEPRGDSGRYQLITKLGQGGMARVLLMLARGRTGVNKLLVVKELLPDLDDDPEFLAMFLEEARLAARLNHPNVVQTYEVNDEGATPVIVMEYLEGQSLTVLLNRIKRSEMPVPLHLHVLVQVLSGLHHAHELCDFDGTALEVVHRDVSPQNVFVTYEGQVKLVDFGIAKAASSPGRTRAGVFKGKVSYASPEQTVSGEVDRRSDLFAVGVMLWEALARKRMTFKEADAVVIRRRITGEDPKIRDVVPETPEELARICERAMALAPEDRFATAEEFRAALVAYLDTTARVGTHELAGMMKAVFARDRAKIRAMIDVRVKELASSVPPTTLATALTSTLPAMLEGTPPTGTDPSREVPLPTGTDPSREVSLPTGTDPSREVSLSAAKPVSMGPPPTPTPSRRLRTLLPLGLASVCAAAIVLAQVSRRTTDGASAPIDAGIAMDPAPAPSPPDAGPLASATVDITLAGEPQQAHLFLDGIALAANPFHSTVPRSAQLHLVRISARGYTTEERLVSFENDLQLSLTLAPASTTGEPAPPVSPQRYTHPVARAPAVAPEAPSPPTAATPPSPGGALPVGPRKQPRAIDSTF